MPIFFDIETGGLNAHKSSILSLSVAGQGTGVRTLVANPVPGSFMSAWAEGQVWEPVKNRASMSERELLEQFTGVLEKAPAGETLAGWNIGYDAVPQDLQGRAKGFDIPFMLTRAEAYGLRERMTSAIGRMNVRDVGQEYAARLATEVLQYEDVVSKEVFESASGYFKDTRMTGSTPAELARQAVALNRNVAGWKQELVHDIVFPGVAQQAHQSEFDVKAAMKLAAHEGPIFKGPEDAARYSNQVLINKLISSAKTGTHDDINNSLESLLQKARSPVTATGKALPSVEKEFLSQLAERASTSKVPWERIVAGEGFGRESGSLWADKVAGLKSVGVSKFAEGAKNFAKNHKVALGIGLGVGALWMLQPGRFISGKDDNHNTIEGLRHGGLAELNRRMLSDFGSGWIRAALSKGISPVEIARKLAGQKGVTTGLTGMTTDEFVQAVGSKKGDDLVSFIRDAYRVKGEKEMFTVTQTYRAGGMGQTFKLEGRTTGRPAIYKVAKEGVGGHTIEADMVMAGPAILKSRGITSATGIFREMSSGSATSSYIKEYMGQIAAGTGAMSGGKLSPAYEAGLQQVARQQYGDIVPEVLGVTPKGFIQEYAGQPIPMHKATLPALNKMGDIWERMIVGGGERVRHFDPQKENIVRQGTKLRVIDYGVAAQGPRLSPRSEQAAKDVIKDYIGKLREEILPVINQPPPYVAPAAGPLVKTVPARGPRPVVPSPSPASPELVKTKIHGLPDDGLAAAGNKKTTDFGSPVNLGKAVMRAKEAIPKRPSIFDRIATKKQVGMSDVTAIDPQFSIDRAHRFQTTHRRAQVESSQNALRPGMRHRQRTGGIVR